MITISKKGNWENVCGTAGESLISSQAGAPSTKTTTRWFQKQGEASSFERLCLLIHRA